MANHSDDESIGAPENFHITNENDEDGSHWNNGKVKCPLCCYSRKSFHCRYCIRDGNFVHSSHHLVERFAEKQQKYKNLKSVHRAQQGTCLQLLHKRKLAEDLNYAIKQKKDNITILKKLIAERVANKEQLTRKCRELTQTNNYSRKQIPQYVSKCQQLADYIATTNERNNKQSDQKDKLFNELKQYRVRNVQRLIQFVFPLSQQVLKSEITQIVNSASDGSGDSQLVDVNDMGAVGGDMSIDALKALAEASRTTYVRGRWVLQDSNGESQYVIVAPSLPENGDYAAYNDWVATIKDGVPNSAGACESLISTNSAYRISAALTYTAQLVTLLSYYLDVRLPFKLNYSDFCKKELNEQSFSRKVHRLNGNILHLCYTQCVKLNMLSLNHTLENINILLDTKYSDLGRIGAVGNNDGFSGTTNFQLYQKMFSSTHSGSEDDDENGLNEWEAVSHPYQPPDLLFPTNIQNHQQAASVAGGLVTSAVQSVASIWRVFTTKNA